MTKMKILSVVGARPNFIKIAPFVRAINAYNQTSTEKIRHILVHTGQHYDNRMSGHFFRELNIPFPDMNLEVGSGTHAEQVGNTMIAFEKVIKNEKPDWVVVVGDVNATLACSVTAKKENIKCCHIEAGLRSGDMAMPEEINRLVTDRISDLLLTPDMISQENLLAEGMDPGKISFVGNIMIDTLELNRQKAAGLNFMKTLSDNIIKKNHFKLSLHDKSRAYGLITLHRPSNVDDEKVLKPIIEWLINDAGKTIPLIWPIHPRLVIKAKQFGLYDRLLQCENLLLLQPVGYLEMLHLNMNARIMLTDSGGLQEECCVLGTPFLTLRWNTERPVTLKKHGGVGYLTGNDIVNIRKEFSKAINEERNPVRPELWDGNTAHRCLDAIVKHT
jgi:UDP-N-acetylglucosamine 2-epimerase (non-hydrolysing)